jgi:hypothetical protein
MARADKPEANKNTNRENGCSFSRGIFKNNPCKNITVSFIG